MSALTYAEFRAYWDAMTDEEREPVRAKAQWEHMGLFAVLIDWPSLIPERLREPVSLSRPDTAGDERGTT